jgi:biopolymer transport protein ExbB
MNHFNKPSAMTQTRTLQRLFSAILALVVLCAAPGLHAADGGQKKKLVIDTTAAGVEVKEELTQVPVLVRLHSGNFTFAEAQSDGSDLHFFAADGKTPLPSQVENFDATDELANVWLLVPKVAALGKTPLVMTWGGDKAGAAPAGGKVQDPAAVFTFHFAAADVLKDSTANAIAATSVTAKSVAAGPIGAAVALDGGAGIALASSPSLKLAASTGFTFSAWIKPADVTTATAGLLALPADGNALRIGLAAGKLEVAMGTASVSASPRASSSTAHNDRRLQWVARCSAGAATAVASMASFAVRRVDSSRRLRSSARRPSSGVRPRPWLTVATHGWWVGY